MHSIGNAPVAAAFAGSESQIITGTIQEELFLQGKAFSWEDRLTFGADEVKTIVFDMSLFTGGRLFLNPLIVGASSGPILIDFYTGPTYDLNGTILGASNRIEGKPAPKSVLRLNPTNVSLGALFSGDTVFATGAGVGNANPGANLLGNPFQIITDKAITVTNNDGADTIVQFKLTWFED